MPDTGWKNPTAVDAASDWTNSSNVLVSDSVYATTGTAGKIVVPKTFILLPLLGAGFVGHYYVVSNIEVQVEAYVSGIGTKNVTLDGNLSWDNGSTWTSATRSASWVSTEGKSYKSLTGFEAAQNGITWNRAWTESELSNANFLCKITVASITSFATVFCDNIQVKVTYARVRHGTRAVLYDEERLLSI